MRAAEDLKSRISSDEAMTVTALSGPVTEHSSAFGATAEAAAAVGAASSSRARKFFGNSRDKCSFSNDYQKKDKK